MMGKEMTPVELAVRPDGFTPRAFRWDDGLVRVLSVESVRTCGTERRYRVLTGHGRFELSFFSDGGQWCVRRGPTRLGRALCRWEAAPRYSLPTWRRRARRRLAGATRGV